MLEGLAQLRADGWQLHLTSSQQGMVDNLLLESDGHTLFVREELERTQTGQVTVQECFAAYAEYCNERGWVTLPRNKFSQAIGDIVARQYGLTVRHVPDVLGKSQRGWRGLALREKNRPVQAAPILNTFDEDFEAAEREAIEQEEFIT